MVSKVLYRPFEETDFDTIAMILQAQWHTGDNQEVYNFLEACDDLAYCLINSTFSQVALVDDVPRGIVLARTGERDPAWIRRWARASDDFMTQMRSVDKKALDRYLEFIAATVKITDRLIKEGGVDPASEITLLAVDETARGLGIGSVLLDAARSELSSRGCSQAYLCTDTTCDWKFYEARGMKRVARYSASWEERRLLPREMYLYRMTISD